MYLKAAAELVLKFNMAKLRQLPKLIRLLTA